MKLWSSRMESGYQQLLDRMARVERDRLSIVATVRTSAGPTRSAGDNYRVLAIQKRLYGRDPWFLDRSEQRAIAERIRSLIGASLPSAQEMMAFGRAIANLIVSIYRRHIDAGRSQSGQMRGLAKSTRSAKIKKGTISKPILVDTGELVGSIVADVEVL